MYYINYIFDFKNEKAFYVDELAANSASSRKFSSVPPKTNWHQKHFTIDQF